jgi:hypothetical protein
MFREVSVRELVAGTFVLYDSILVKKTVMECAL